MQHKTNAAKSARFTLVELLTVVVILLILVALLLPSLSRARFSGNVADCGSRMKQWGVSFYGYAADHDRYYPNHTISAGIGLNPWGIGKDFDNDLVQYGLPLELYSCPINPVPEAKFIRYYESSNAMIMFGYSYWVPRTASNGSLVTAANAAPTGISKTANQENPVLTDMLAFNAGTLSPGTSGMGVNLTAHWFRSYAEILNVNHMYQDGHVETIDAGDLGLRQSLDPTRDVWY